MLPICARRLISSYRPVRLGQTRTGYVLAAALVALWMLERPALAATVSEQGASENQHIRIDWWYYWERGDCGWGGFVVSLKDEATDGLRPVALRKVEFCTLGLPFEQLWASELGPHEPCPIGVLDGQTLYRYSFVLPVTDPGGRCCLSASGPLRSEGVGLFNTQASYSVDVTPADGSGGVWSVDGTLEFVSVQTIPEPSPAAFGLLAAVASIVRRRRGQ